MLVTHCHCTSTDDNHNACMIVYCYFLTDQSQADFRDVLIDRDFDTNLTPNPNDSKIGFYEQVASSLKTVQTPCDPMYTPSPTQWIEKSHTPNTPGPTNGLRDNSPHPLSVATPSATIRVPTPIKLPPITQTS